jgi:hypothetical protein
MTAIITIAVLLVLVAGLARLVVATPLLRTLGVTIDCWADSVQGDGDRLR